MKVCNKCKVEKEVILFSKNKRNKDGLETRCKSCISEIGKEYYFNKKEIVLKRNRRSYNKNRDIILQRNKSRYRKSKKKVLKQQKKYVGVRLI